MHTSDVEGQIYLPAVNMLMAVACVLVVLLFGSAERLAAAYGLAVTGVMVVSTVLFAVVAVRRWHWPLLAVVPLIVFMLSVDLLLVAANALKIPDGGWMPLAVAALVLWIVGVWRSGVRRINRSRLEDGLPLARFVESIAQTPRWPGTGVFFGRDPSTTPVTIRKLQRHVPSLPETVVIVHLQPLGVPRVPFQNRLRVQDLGTGVWLATVRFGYLQPPDIPSMLRDSADRGVPTDPASTSYWVRREQVSLAGAHAGMGRWRLAMFAFLLRNANVLPDMLDLPPRRTVEMGMRTSL